MKVAFGKFLKSLANGISAVLEFFINIFEKLVLVVQNIRQVFIAMAGLGCVFLFMSPLGIFLLMEPTILILLLILFGFPLLGTKFVSFLRYIHYVFTEFLNEKADYLITGKQTTYDTIGGYSSKYKQEKENERRRAQQEWYRQQQEAQRRQQEEWNRRFREWQSGGGYNYDHRYQQNSQNHYNPTTDFNTQYEKSCDVLGVDYNADTYQIKLAYRKAAKQYHPDLNQSPGAKEKFQEINNAYEFLNDENIQRYKNLHR